MDGETRRRLVEHFRRRAAEASRDRESSVCMNHICVCGSWCWAGLCPSCFKAIADELEKGGEQ